MKKINFCNLNKNELNKKEMGVITGGAVCGCGCSSGVGGMTGYAKGMAGGRVIRCCVCENGSGTSGSAAG